MVCDKIELRKQVQHLYSFTEMTLAPHHGLFVLTGCNVDIHHCIVGMPAHRSIKVPRVFDERRAIFQQD